MVAIANFLVALIIVAVAVAAFKWLIIPYFRRAEYHMDERDRVAAEVARRLAEEQAEMERMRAAAEAELNQVQDCPEGKPNQND